MNDEARRLGLKIKMTKTKVTDENKCKEPGTDYDRRTRSNRSCGLVHLLGSYSL